MACRNQPFIGQQCAKLFSGTVHVPKAISTKQVKSPEIVRNSAKVVCNCAISLSYPQVACREMNTFHAFVSSRAHLLPFSLTVGRTLLRPVTESDGFVDWRSCLGTFLARQRLTKELRCFWLVFGIGNKTPVVLLNLDSVLLFAGGLAFCVSGPVDDRLHFLLSLVSGVRKRPIWLSNPQMLCCFAVHVKIFPLACAIAVDNMHELHSNGTRSNLAETIPRHENSSIEKKLDAFSPASLLLSTQEHTNHLSRYKEPFCHCTWASHFR